MTLAPEAPDLSEIAKQSEVKLETTNKVKTTNKPKAKKAKGKVKQIEKEKVKQVDPVINFKVYGVGGAGRIACNRYAKRHKDTRVTVMDTTKGITQLEDNVDAHHIEGLRGSGKLRAANAEPIQNFITEFSSENPFHEISIVVCSIAGGSGSVISPLLVREMFRNKKNVILISLFDNESEVDIVNTLNSLRSFESISGKAKAYLPTVLFANNLNGRKAVDKGIDEVLDMLTTVLSDSFNELDNQDIRNFFSPSSMMPHVSPGMKLLNITNDKEGEWLQDRGMVTAPDPQKLDSALIISSVDDDIRLTVKSTVVFRGYFDESSDHEAMVVGLGYTVPKEVIADMNEEIHSHHNITANTATTIDVDEDYDNATKTDSGLYL